MAGPLQNSWMYAPSGGYTPTTKGIFAYGNDGSVSNLSNLVSSSGTVAADVSGVGTSLGTRTSATFGIDKAFFWGGEFANHTNLVSNEGVIASDVTGVGLIRGYLAACTFGGDKAIFGYGSHYTQGASPYSTTNLVNNEGVIASNVSGVGTARGALGACGFGSDKGIFAFGLAGSHTAISNKVNNNGVVASDTSGVGTARQDISAAGFSIA